MCGGCDVLPSELNNYKLAKGPAPLGTRIELSVLQHEKNDEVFRTPPVRPSFPFCSSALLSTFFYSGSCHFDRLGALRVGHYCFF